MATYDELLQASENEPLKRKVRVAIIVAAEKIRVQTTNLPTNHARRLKWAAQAFTSPDSVQDTMLRVILAQNRAATLSQITGADDATVQVAVDAAVDLFADLLV